MTTDTVNLGPKTQLIPMNERGIVTRTIEDAYRFANAVVASGLAPRHFDTPEKVIIAIQHGAEVGLSKMQSLNSIAVINNRACLWGDALPALVWASGKCEDIIEHFEGDCESNDYKAVCEVRRVGKTTSAVATFSVSDAKVAGLWGKAGPWKNYPKRMLKIRARSFAFRDTFADVLCGMAVAEEMQDIQQDEPLPQIANGAEAMLNATLDGMVGCKTQEDRDAVCMAFSGETDPSAVLRDIQRAANEHGWNNLLSMVGNE